MADERCEAINALKIAELEKRFDLHVKYQREATEKAVHELHARFDAMIAQRLWVFSTIASIAGGAIGSLVAYLLK